MIDCPVCKGTGKIEAEHKPTLDQPEKVNKWLCMVGHNQGPQEKFVVLLLDAKRKLIQADMVSLGTGTEALLNTSIVFRNAIVNNAHSVILSHNHPSGDSWPSKADIRTTRDLLDAGRVLGIEVADHIITTPNGEFTSLRSKSLVYWG